MNNMHSIDLNKGIRLHTMNTTKFKTTALCLYIHNNINEYATLNALIPSVIKSGSNNFNNSTVISEYLENMYGAVFETDIIKKGEIQSILFYLQFISNRYANEENVLYKIVDFISDIVLNPIVNSGVFKSEYVSLEKNNLKERIESRINDKARYAIEKCMEIMCKNEPFSIYKYGNIDDIKSIDEKKLYDHYKKILRCSPIDIFLVGDFSSDGIEDLFKEKFQINDRSIAMLNGLNINSNIKSPKIVKEDMDVNQGKLCMAYRTGIPFTDERYPALSVYISILGGGLHSKLFQNVREKASMAYYANSAIEKFKAIMVINSGIEAKNYDNAVELIQEQVDDIRKGNITDYELKSSKKIIKSDLKSVSDNVPLMIDYDLGGKLYGKEIDLEELERKVDQVDKRQIIEVSESIKLDTIFFLKPYDK